MIYELLLYDEQGSARLAQTFNALDDDDALDIAHGVYGALSDRSDGYEVWQGSRQIIDGTKPQSQLMASEALIAKRVESMLDLEERLASSYEAIRRSQTLLKRMGELRSWHDRTGKKYYM